MCGIVGYVGSKQAAPLLLDGLEKLEYRGYDSAGLAVINEDGIRVEKSKGRLSALRALTDDGRTLPGSVGIGHTRWATHGEPSDINSHPHLSRSGRVAVVHNGIVENYMQLRDFLLSHGYAFVSDTDTEIVSQLMDYCYAGDPIAAVQKAVSMLEGSFALGILFSDYSWQLIAVRKDNPLVVGIGDNENFIASDIPALLKHTRSIMRLNEREVAVVTSSAVTVFDRNGDRVEKQTEQVLWDVAAAERGGYEHFMIKEIMEQPKAVRDTISPRIKDGRVELELTPGMNDVLKSVSNIIIIACGSAYHVGCIGALMMRRMLHIPVSAELASEFRFSYPVCGENTLCIIISQSGETADTLLALREAKKLGAKVISVVNVVGSTIANESDEVLYTFAGPEIAVATTKAYSAQLAMMYLLALRISDARGSIDKEEYEKCVEALFELPDHIGELLKRKEQIQYLASLYFNLRDIFFLGRNMDYALALEGSLKLKEISYIHSEAYAAGELKHGTISLVEKGTLLVALCTNERLLDKMVSSIREVKARGGVVIALAGEGAPGVEEAADHVIWLPRSQPFTLPSLSVIPLQLFAYYMASLKGCDIDKPRNLAKSVTVE
ncbi:MAG: Glutamine--fructose-6-phosphate aminotransferase (isomerizing) [Firmicutes bacterium ADurb.Bin182]|nr:MAG: Glutamine--fructose-6-phosphate aminotransferase (isomerizing) [Firmicutes bacterium ADurb.Bin182]